LYSKILLKLNEQLYSKFQKRTLEGVSLATISRVINNNTRVSITTRQKVEDAMQVLNYRP